MTTSSLKFPWPTVRHQSSTITSDDPRQHVTDRQDRVPGFSSPALADAHILLIGAGGLGSEIATGLVRKGLGRLDICDADTVELSNLNRQLFSKADLYQPKALRLASNVVAWGVMGSQVAGHYTAFNPETAELLLADADIAIVGTDNNLSRAQASTWCQIKQLPAIFCAVSETADYGWVFVQDPTGSPCPACVFPRIGESDKQRQLCQPSPAVLDILRSLAGFVLYAVDSLLMSRRRAWNFRSLHLVGDVPDCIDFVRPRPNCPLCIKAER